MSDQKIVLGGDDWQLRAAAAEKTVVVLKKKVKSLYNGDGKTGIEQQLERAKKRQEEVKRRQEMMEVRQAALQKHAEKLEDEVAARTHDLRAILDNVTFGFVVVDSELTVQPGFTKSCPELFGKAVKAGNSFLDLLDVKHQTSRDDFLLGIDQVFEDIMPEEVSLSQLPSRFEINDRVLKVEAGVIRDEKSSDVVGTLMTISDVTDFEEAKRQARENQVLVSILRQQDPFKAFVVDTRKLIQTARESYDAGDKVTLARAVHTVKGNAASYGLDDLVHKVHEVESRPSIEPKGIDEIEEVMRSFLKKHFEVIGVDYDADNDDAFTVDAEAMTQLMKLTSGGAEDVDALKRWTASILRKPARHLLGPIESFVSRLAQRLEKEVHFVVEGDQVLVDVESLKPITQTMSHLIRNSLDHGLEYPGERGAKGRTGNLRLVVEDRGAEYSLRVQDDGRGIDGHRLVEKAIQNRMLTQDKAYQLSHEERLELIFMDNLSTADAATDISGRGVGMAAVRASVEAAGGKLWLESELGKGTTMHITVPKPALLAMAAAGELPTEITATLDLATDDVAAMSRT